MAAETAVWAESTVAQGQAMTSMTVKARHALPVISRVRPVAARPRRTMERARPSATDSMGALVSSESSTWRMMRAR